jgi:hypothetical protein
MPSKKGCGQVVGCCCCAAGFASFSIPTLENARDESIHGKASFLAVGQPPRSALVYFEKQVFHGQIFLRIRRGVRRGLATVGLEIFPSSNEADYHNEKGCHTGGDHGTYQTNMAQTGK